MGRRGPSSRQAALPPMPPHISPPLHSAFFLSTQACSDLSPLRDQLNDSHLFHSHSPYLPPPPQGLEVLHLSF